MGKSGDVGRHWHRFWQIFWLADDFFVEAPKLKVSLTDPPIFMGFVIGEASGDGRPIIGRQSADFLKSFHYDIGRQSAVDRQRVGRWHFIREPSADRRRISTVIRPMITRLSAIINYCLCYIVYNACIRIIYEITSCIYFILGFISLDLVYK